VRDLQQWFTAMAECCCVLQLLEDMLTMFDLLQLWQVDSNCVELEQIGLRMLLAFCANGVLDVSYLFFCESANHFCVEL